MNKKLRVILADTSHESQSRYKAMSVWEENGFAVTAAVTNTGETVRLCKTGGADLVVCRSNPPLLNAPDVIREVQHAAGETAFLVISHKDDPESMRECFLLGAVDFLTEPVSEQRIAEALERAKKLIKRSAIDCEYRLAAEEFFSSLDIPGADGKFLAELKDFIIGAENVTATTEYAADCFGFNKDYFGRLFKARMGMTFVEFYKRFRVCYAERLLRSGRYKVREVSELLGFASVDYFTSVFRKYTGKKPSELKRAVLPESK